VIVPVPNAAGSSDFKAVGAAEVDFDVSMAADQFWLFISSTDCYIAQAAATPAASAADGSMFVPAKLPVLLKGSNGAKLSVIRVSADGVATLTLCQRW
jgi:hypothetical protein